MESEDVQAGVTEAVQGFLSTHFGNWEYSNEKAKLFHTAIANGVFNWLENTFSNWRYDKNAQTMIQKGVEEAFHRFLTENKDVIIDKIVEKASLNVSQTNNFS